MPISISAMPNTDPMIAPRIFGNCESDVGAPDVDGMVVDVAVGGEVASSVGSKVVGVSSGTVTAFAVNFSVAFSQQLSRALKIHKTSLGQVST